ncbi:hypothetical protein ACRWQM_02770 [Shewanella sp. HL-SH5]|uniref:hypothetical protein n=1 Tax=Shewanella sp. HL-SH5 TaxID=3436241 RepID=UPI003EB775BF
MESTFKSSEHDHQGISEALDIENNTATVISDGSLHPKSELSNLELMELWRRNLHHLLQQLGLKSSDDMLVSELKDINSEIIEKLHYLKKTDEQLKLDSDFTLSNLGFEKYKSAHLLVVNFFTELYKQKKAEEERASAKFYFFSRAKHVSQQKKTIPWFYALSHSILLIVSCLILAVVALSLFILTQQNLIVIFLVFVSVIHIFSIAIKKIKKYKISARTPLRFLVSFLSICSQNVVLYATFFIVVPSVIVFDIKPYWLDDFIIIGLAIFSFVIWEHSRETSKPKVSSDNKKVVLNDTANCADAKVKT